jgi:site-specific DNA-methyltransferase (adenine-specific)
MLSFFKSPDRHFNLLHGNCVELLRQFDFKFDMIFADPPYFLSNDGISIQSGKPVCVNKGEWDRSKGYDFVNDFNYQWLKEVRLKLKDNGTIWVSGTYHNIFSVAQMLNDLNFKVLNVVTWVKPNPPPNLACRCFTHSSEVIIWARRDKKVPHYFNYQWLKEVRLKLKDNGTIWVSGTYHNIFSVAQMLNDLKFKVLNVVTWVKPNPPPNLACRCFTHSSEVIIWARKDKKVPHYFNYELMRKINDGKQMKDVWELPAIARWEKSCGKHPAQKPLGLLARIILASTQPKAWILDPFTGSSTTGIAANLLDRKFLGIDSEIQFLEMSQRRREEISNLRIFEEYRKKIQGFNDSVPGTNYLLCEDSPEYGEEFPV